MVFFAGGVSLKLSVNALNNRHTPLVTMERWDRVKHVCKNRRAAKPKRKKHRFAYSNLIKCRHYGCDLVAELKKQKYTYYHCTGYKDKCEEPYVREEVLEEQFGKVIQSPPFAPETLDWITSALNQSHQDEKQFHDDSIERQNSLKSNQLLRNADCSIWYYRTQSGAMEN